MATSEEVFADSNYFVSLFNQGDSRYSAARTFAQRISQENISLVVSNLIFLEAVTVLSQRRNRAVAIASGESLLSHPHIRIVHVDETLQQETWNMFQEIVHKNISFVDYSILATMRAEGISKLLTFDKKDFKQLQKNYRFSFYE